MQLQLNVTVDVISDHMELNTPEDWEKNYHGAAKDATLAEVETAINDALSLSGVIGTTTRVSVNDYVLDENERTMMEKHWETNHDLDDKRRHWLNESEDVFGIKHAEWSMYEAFNDGEHTINWMQPAHNFSDEPTVFISSNSWGKEYTSSVYTSPTLKDLFIEADRSIIGTGDHHHVFLEGIKGKRNEETGLIEIHMWFGS